jgi:hypothetical protein
VKIDRSLVIAELGWHCDRPAAIYAIMTDEEKHEITQKGFMTKTLWTKLEKRLASQLEA